MGLAVNFHIPIDEFLQILHSPLNHWVTVTGHGLTNGVKLYDSRYTTLTTLLQAQIAALMCTESDTIQWMCKHR